MAMDNYKMPTVQQFLSKKVMGAKSEPPWVFLEREMKQNTETKPYNDKVGDWLKFMKDLKHYQYREGKKKYKMLEKNVGPVWYCELSSLQQEKLNSLKECIHQDLIEGLPIRTRRCLYDIGITAKPTKDVLMKAMNAAIEDPGLFIWKLYTAIYKQQPCMTRPVYDLDARILMSCLVFIDKDECIETLAKLAAPPEKVPSPPPKRKPKPKRPTGKYNEYLQKHKVKYYGGLPLPEPAIPEPVAHKIKLRSEESYEKLCEDTSFLEKRVEKNQQTKPVERVCNYKFWEPPSSLRNTDPKMAALVEAMKMLKKKAKPKFKSPFPNLQYTIGGIAFIKGSPHFIINAVSILPTGYIPINGGVVKVMGKDYVTNILGYWKFPKDVKQKCDDTCDCLVKWERKIMDYVKESKCQCGHLYDYHNEGALKEKYFHKPGRHGSYWIDYAKIYQMDPTEDFIKDTVEDALRSVDLTPAPSRPTLDAAGMKPKELLAALLADISDSPLMIPHLPQANLLSNIQEWVRNRVQGPLTEQQHKKLRMHSARQWGILSQQNFKANAYRIPFSNKQLKKMNWSHRKMIHDLGKILLDDFSLRNRQQLLDQSRLWWATTKYDAYANRPFLDTFFTYMPGRLQDSFVINPYSSELTPKFGAKTCPL